MALIGWFATGAREVKHEPLVSTKSTSARTSAATKNNREPGVYRVPPYATKHVNAIRAAGDAAAQMRATLALVNSLPLAELHHWMEGRWFDDREGFNLSLFNLVAKERWMREDPSGYYAWAIKNTASDPHSAARLWVQKDPSGALEYLKKIPNQAC